MAVICVLFFLFNLYQQSEYRTSHINISAVRGVLYLSSDYISVVVKSVTLF